MCLLNSLSLCVTGINVPHPFGIESVIEQKLLKEHEDLSIIPGSPLPLFTMLSSLMDLLAEHTTTYHGAVNTDTPAPRGEMRTYVCNTIAATNLC